MQATADASERHAEGRGAKLAVDDLGFSVQRSARRRTMQITLGRDSELVLSAPPAATDAQLRAFVLEKRFWIYSKLAEKQGFRPAGVAGRVWN